MAEWPWRSPLSPSLLRIWLIAWNKPDQFPACHVLDQTPRMVWQSRDAERKRNAPEYCRYSALLVWKRILTRSRGATAVLA